jgi:HPt (histidine-containing phosphotransfer) domain-containing protein
MVRQDDCGRDHRFVAGEHCIERYLTLAATDISAVDAATIMALQEDGGSLLRELRDLFCTEAPEQLAKMLEGRRNADAKTVALPAHRLKGTAVTFGAGEMQRLCLEIEQRSRGGAVDGVDHIIQELSAECDRVKLALDQAIDHSS